MRPRFDMTNPRRDRAQARAHVGDLEKATIVPTTCDTQPLTAQEKALEFLFFDLSLCVQDDSLPPEQPR
jgi:hypothetical protein